MHEKYDLQGTQDDFAKLSYILEYNEHGYGEMNEFIKVIARMSVFI
jgi:hypothetical protein